MIASCMILQIIIAKKKDISFDLFCRCKIPGRFYKLILSVGVPTASESLSYNVSQIVIMAMISTLGTYAMSAQVYTATICRFVYFPSIFSHSLSIFSISSGDIGCYQNRLERRRGPRGRDLQKGLQVRRRRHRLLGFDYIADKPFSRANHRIFHQARRSRLACFHPALAFDLLGIWPLKKFDLHRSAKRRRRHQVSGPLRNVLQLGHHGWRQLLAGPKAWPWRGRLLAWHRNGRNNPRPCNDAALEKQALDEQSFGLSRSQVLIARP